MYYLLRRGLHSAWEAKIAEDFICAWNSLHPEDHAKLGEGYTTAEGTMKKSSWAKVSNWSDSESESASDDDDEDDSDSDDDNEEDVSN